MDGHCSSTRRSALFIARMLLWLEPCAEYEQASEDADARAAPRRWDRRCGR